MFYVSTELQMWCFQLKVMIVTITIIVPINNIMIFIITSRTIIVYCMVFEALLKLRAQAKDVVL